MNRRTFVSAAGALLASCGIFNGKVFAVNRDEPGGMNGSLGNALTNRQSIRDYSDKDLHPLILDYLLWAAWGVNRPESGKRTAPSALNRQEIQLWITKRDGFYLYDADKNEMIKKGDSDIRAVTGTQSYVANAPVNLVYVVDTLKAVDDDIMQGANVGCICQNVYLFCASENLATVARTSIDTDALHKAMNLGSSQRIIMAQCVGYPAA